MRQAQTLNEAQLRRVIQYCRSRRHPTRDQTIILFSFYAGLRAKEIAALKRGDVFDDEGNARTQFTLSAEQSKGGKTRTVYLNQRLRRALMDYAAGLNLRDPNRALFESQKGDHFSANTMCQLFLDIYKAVGLKDALAIRDAELTLHGWQIRAWAFDCWRNWRGIHIFPPRNATST